MWLRQSTAVEIALGPFVDSTDGFTAETALVVGTSDIRLKKTFENWDQAEGFVAGATHEENGWYSVTLGETDTNTLGQLIVAISVAGARPVYREFIVVTQQFFDGAALAQSNPVRPSEPESVSRVQPGTVHVMELAAITDPPQYGKSESFDFTRISISVDGTVTEIAVEPVMVEAASATLSGAITAVTSDPVSSPGGGPDGEDVYDIPVTSSLSFAIGSFIRARDQASGQGRVYEVIDTPDLSTLQVLASTIDIADGDTVEQVDPTGRYYAYLSIDVDEYLSIEAQSGQVMVEASALMTGPVPFDATTTLFWSKILELDLVGFNFRAG